MKTRLEKDSVGELAIPADAYYGVQSQRGCNNFQISGRLMHPNFIKNITLIKKAAAKTNGKYGYIDKEGNLVMNRALQKFQTGSSTKPVTAYAPGIDSKIITQLLFYITKYF